MRKYEDLNLTDKFLAIAITKLQEFSLKLIIINRGGNKEVIDFIDKIYNRLHKAHFKLFYGSSLDELIEKIKNTDPKQGAILATKVLMPLCIRSAKMNLKIDRMYLGRKSHKNSVALLASILLGSLVLNKPQNEVFELLKDKIESDAKKAS